MDTIFDVLIRRMVYSQPIHLQSISWNGRSIRLYLLNFKATMLH
jgi:hypothetical protein